MALNPSKHRANDLLDRILSAEAASLAEVAEALMVSPDSIMAYRSGLAMPIERQALLAAFAIERTRKFVRQGYSLRGQIRATIRFVAGDTVTHEGPPPPAACGGWI